MRVCVITGMEYDSNIYLIPGKVPTIIDAGTGFHSRTVLQKMQLYLQPRALQQIILTHEHFDHVGGVPEVLNAAQGHAAIIAHASVVEKLKLGISTFAEMLGGTMPRITVDQPVSGGEHLTVGDDACEILSTPGHSPGCLCLYDEHSKTLFSGDTVFAYGGFGRYDFPGGSLGALRHSLEHLATLDVANLYPGHGPFVEHHGRDHILKALHSISTLV